MNRLEHKIPSILVFINGILCLFFSKQIYSLLPTILGLMMTARGISMLIMGIRQQEYRNEEGSHIGFAIMSLTVGIGVLIRQSDAIFIVGMFWGIHGLREAAIHANKLILQLFVNKEKVRNHLALIVQFLIGFVMSTALIFDPVSKTEHHVLLLGAELLYEGLVGVAEKRKHSNEELK